MAKLLKKKETKSLEGQQRPEVEKHKLTFPTGRDRATFRDKGTEVSSLSRDKGTTEQAQNLAKGQPFKLWDGTRNGTVQDFDSLSRPNPRDKTGKSRNGKQERMF